MQGTDAHRPRTPQGGTPTPLTPTQPTGSGTEDTGEAACKQRLRVVLASFATGEHGKAEDEHLADALCAAVNPPDMDLTYLPGTAVARFAQTVWAAAAQLAAARSDVGIRFITLPGGMTEMPPTLLAQFPSAKTWGLPTPSALMGDTKSPTRNRNLNGVHGMWCYKLATLWLQDRQAHRLSGHGQFNYTAYASEAAIGQRVKAGDPVGSKFLQLLHGDRGSIVFETSRFGGLLEEVARPLTDDLPLRQFLLLGWDHWMGLEVQRVETGGTPACLVCLYDPLLTDDHTEIPCASPKELAGLCLEDFLGAEMTGWNFHCIRPAKEEKQPASPVAGFARLIDFHSSTDNSARNRACELRMHEEHRADPLLVQMLAKGNLSASLSALLQTVQESGPKAFAACLLPFRDRAPPALTAALQWGAKDAVGVLLTHIRHALVNGLISPARWLNLVTWAGEATSFKSAIDYAVRTPEYLTPLIAMAAEALSQPDWQTFAQACLDQDPPSPLWVEIQIARAQKWRGQDAPDTQAGDDDTTPSHWTLETKKAPDQAVDGIESKSPTTAQEPPPAQSWTLLTCDDLTKLSPGARIKVQDKPVRIVEFMPGKALASLTVASDTPQSVLRRCASSITPQKDGSLHYRIDDIDDHALELLEVENDAPPG